MVYVLNHQLKEAYEANDYAAAERIERKLRNLILRKELGLA